MINKSGAPPPRAAAPAKKKQCATQEAAGQRILAGTRGLSTPARSVQVRPHGPPKRQSTRDPTGGRRGGGGRVVACSPTSGPPRTPRSRL
eukprot:6155097-Pyramimonas_sp.AAC.1